MAEAAPSTRSTSWRSFNDPTLCATLPLDAVAPLLMQIAVGMTRLTALQHALAARVLAARELLSAGEEGLMRNLTANGHPSAAPRELVMDLPALLQIDPVAVATIPLQHLPTLHAELAALHSRLAAIEHALAARWRTGSVAPPPRRSAGSLSEQGALTQEAAAEAYCIPLRTLRRLTRTKRVPSYLLGRNRMIRPADLDRYLARCREQGVKVGTILDV
jgi:excisionase family DNA binding protein